MAKKKYNWDEARERYEKFGDSQAEIRKEFNIPRSSLSTRIKEENWKLSEHLTEQLNEDIEVFREATERVSERLLNAKNDPIVQEVILEKVNTVLEDNKMLQNNRKIGLGLQAIVGKAMANGEVQVNQVPALSGAIKNLEAIANPVKPNQVNVQQNSNVSIMTQEEKREQFKKRKLEILGS